MALVGNLLIGIKGDNKGFKKSTTDTTKSIMGMKMKFPPMAAAGAAAFAAVAAAAVGAALAVKGLVDEQFPLISQNGNLSKKLGLSIEQLKAFQLAAKNSGAETEDLQEGLKNLNEKVGLARMGDSGALEQFQRLGIAAEDLEGLGTEDTLKLLADRFSAIDDETQKAAIGLELMGEEGWKLNGMLSKGSGYIDEMIQKNKEIGGGMIDEGDAAQVAAYTEQMNYLSEMMTNVKQKVAAELAPILKVLAETMVGWFGDISGVGDTISNVIQFIAKGFGWLGNIIQGYFIYLKTLRQAFLEIFNIVMQMASGFIRLLNLIPGVGKKLDGAVKFFDNINKKTKEYRKDMVKDWTEGEWASEGVSNFFENVEKEKKKAIEEAKKSREVAAPLTQISEESKTATENITTLIAKLKEQNKMFGMSEQEAARYQASMSGVSKELVDQAEALQEQLDLKQTIADANKSVDQLIEDLQDDIYNKGNNISPEMIKINELTSQGADPEKIEEYRKLVGEMKELEEAQTDKERAESLLDQFKTDAEKMSDELAEIQQLYQDGFFSAEQAEMLKAKIKEGYAEAVDESSPGGETGFAGALVAGSQEARSAFLRLTSTNDIPKKQLDEQKKTNKHLERIASGSGGLVAAAI